MIIYSIWIFTQRENTIEAIAYLIIYAFSMIGLLLIVPTVTIILAILLALALYSALSTASKAIGSGLAGGGDNNDNSEPKHLWINGEKFDEIESSITNAKRYKGGTSGRRIEETMSGYRELE